MKSLRQTASTWGSFCDWVFETPAWRRLHDDRHRFLTKKVQHTFHGYAMAQLNKIKTHRSWLLNPPTKKPSREEFGLPIAGGTLSRDDQNRIEQSLAEKIRIDGRLDEPAWSTATMLGNFTEIEPGDNVRPAVETEAMVAYDNDYLYVAFRCYDNNTSAIRATLTDRDRMYADDWVGVFIDT